MLRLTLVLASIAILFSCSSDIEFVENVDEYGYTENYYRKKEDYAKIGIYKRFDPNQKLVEEANYLNDTLDGQRIIYYENGDTQIVEHYKNGLFHGMYKLYHEGNKLNLIGQYEGDAMTGEWKSYYPSGQLEEIVQFKNNEENGPFIEYYENRKLKAEGNYLNGDKEHGLLKLYNEEGILIRKMECDNGICSTIWKANTEE